MQQKTKKTFTLISSNKPAGDQIKAINALNDNLNSNIKNQVLLGVTGSGKTFTIANVIEKQNRPVIVLSHNKTLASQLYIELKELFPNNAVEYFVSNFDYYRPEAYLPKTDTYIDKTSKSNWDLEALRMSALNSITTRRDTIIVASVAAIYGAMNPNEYISTYVPIHKNMEMDYNDFIRQLVKRNYSRNQLELKNSTFQVKGDVISLAPSWTQEYYIRIDFLDNVIEHIYKIDNLTREIIQEVNNFTIFPGDAYTMNDTTIKYCIEEINNELYDRLSVLKKNRKLLEAQRLEERIKHDLESLAEFGVCPGIENYSVYIDRRPRHSKPYTLLDYLPKDTIFFIDESHMMIPQLNAMYKGDYSRKKTLVDYGFRLPSTLDNRPLKFNEFIQYNNQIVYISATPSQYEIDDSYGLVIHQIIRPTGLLEPIISIHKTENQIENIIDELKKQIAKKERSIILTTTIRMSEELAKFLIEKEIKTAYIHSELKTLERAEIIRKLRKGIYDVIVGINLLREGIDIPEVSLVMVLDADQESFFRSHRSLMQICGRAARNVNGRVILYADKITKAMHQTIELSASRRKLQESYNKKHNITPKTIKKPIPLPIIPNEEMKEINSIFNNKKQSIDKINNLIEDLTKKMLYASKKLDFEKAIKLRNIILELKTKI